MRVTPDKPVLGKLGRASTLRGHVADGASSGQASRGAGAQRDAAPAGRTQAHARTRTPAGPPGLPGDWGLHIRCKPCCCKGIDSRAGPSLSRLLGAPSAPALVALPRSPVWRAQDPAARRGPPGAFTQVLLTLLQEKRKGWDISPKVSLKFKTCSLFSKAVPFLIPKSLKLMDPARLSLSALCLPRATGGKRLGVCPRSGRGGCPAKGRVRAEGPERGRWEQEGAPRGPESGGVCSAAARERLQDGASPYGLRPPQVTGSREVRVRLRPWRVCTLPTQTDPESPSLKLHSLTSDFHN